MSSLVSDFLISPVARTVRRISSPFATGPTTPEPVRPFSHDFAAVGHGDAIVEYDAIPIPFPGLRGFPRSPDIALGARSPPLMIPQQRAATAHVEFDPSHPSTAPSDMPSRGAMARHEVSDSETAVAESAVPGPPATSDDAQMTQKRSRRLPADDGKKQLRRRILSIQSSNVTFDQKRYLMQQLLTQDYANAKRAKTVSEGKVQGPTPQNGYLGYPAYPESPSTSTARELGFGETALETLKSWTGLDGRVAINVSDEDRLPTYVPPSAIVIEEEDEDSDDVDGVDGAALVLGCAHYRRNVKLQCVTCDKWYTCRMCHDAAEEHALPRTLTKHMLCMLCGHAQKTSDTCVNCGESAAQYYCNICKLWSDDVNKPIYHCDDCGICRVGHGLDKDFFHCKTCRACISITQTNDHKCIERATDADCPICGENMFASPKTVIFMECGHSIHRACFNEYMASSYKCPICSKSIVNMEALFTNLAKLIQEQPMPEEFRDVRSVILCNDCSAKCSTEFHFLGLRCQICKSFNTAELDRFPIPGEERLNVGAPGQTPATPTTPRSPLQNRCVTCESSSALHSSPQSTPLSLSQGGASPAGHHSHAGAELEIVVDDEEELHFWGGESRSGPESDDDDEDDYEDDTDAENNEEEDEDDDDDDDEDIILLGHR